MKTASAEWIVRGLAWALIATLVGYAAYANWRPSEPLRPSYIDALEDRQARACRDLFKLNQEITGRTVPNAIITAPEDVEPQLRALHRDVC